MKEITQERAGQIALAIIKHTWPNRGLDLSEGFGAKLKKLAKQIGLTQADEHYPALFYARVLLSPTFEKFTGVKIDIHVRYNYGPGPDDDDRKIALALLKTEGINLRGDSFNIHVVKLAQRTGIPVAELKEFFVQEITPQALNYVMGWKSCRIVAEEATLPPALTDDGIH